MLLTLKHFFFFSSTFFICIIIILFILFVRSLYSCSILIKKIPFHWDQFTYLEFYYFRIIKIFSESVYIYIKILFPFVSFLFLFSIIILLTNVKIRIRKFYKFYILSWITNIFLFFLPFIIFPSLYPPLFCLITSNTIFSVEGIFLDQFDIKFSHPTIPKSIHLHMWDFCFSDLF